MSHDVSKLPKWAQSEISRLERDLADARAELAAGPEESDTFAEPYSAAPRPLGEGPLIEFRFGDGWDQKLQASLHEDTLTVRGGSGISVHPVAGSVVEIRVDER